MESLYEPGKEAIRSWKDGTPQEEAPHKANELILPDAPRPHTAPHGV